MPNYVREEGGRLPDLMPHLSVERDARWVEFQLKDALSRGAKKALSAVNPRELRKHLQQLRELSAKGISLKDVMGSDHTIILGSRYVSEIADVPAEGTAGGVRKEGLQSQVLAWTLENSGRLR